MAEETKIPEVMIKTSDLLQLFDKQKLELEQAIKLKHEKENQDLKERQKYESEEISKMMVSMLETLKKM